MLEKLALLDAPPHTLAHANSLDLMVPRIRRTLVQDTDGLAVQFEKVALEGHIAQPCFLVLAIGPVVLDEQRQTSRRAEQNPAHGNLLDLARHAHLEDLRRGCRRGRVKVEALGRVDKDLESLGGAWGSRGAQDDGVQSYLAGKRDDHEKLLIGAGHKFRVWV